MTVGLPDTSPAAPAIYRRRFNRPSNLSPTQRVIFRVDDENALQRDAANRWDDILINLQPVTGHDGQFDLTPFLANFNELEIRFSEATRPHLPGTTRLEITPSVT